MKNKYILKNWDIVGSECFYYLTGNVIGNPKFNDFARVNTSALVRIDFETKLAETMNSIYELK